jgi:NADH-quinone oxidoreductase subunit N
VADALAVDRPTLFLWGTLLALGLGSVLLIADRSVEPAGRSSRRRRARP